MKRADPNTVTHGPTKCSARKPRMNSKKMRIARISSKERTCGPSRKRISSVPTGSLPSGTGPTPAARPVSTAAAGSARSSALLGTAGGLDRHHRDAVGGVVLPRTMAGGVADGERELSGRRVLAVVPRRPACRVLGLGERVQLQQQGPQI